MTSDFILGLDVKVYPTSVDLGKTENYKSLTMQLLGEYAIDWKSDIGEKSLILQANAVEIHDE